MLTHHINTDDVNGNSQLAHATPTQVIPTQVIPAHPPGVSIGVTDHNDSWKPTIATPNQLGPTSLPALSTGSSVGMTDHKDSWKPTILVVDDSAVYRKMLVRLLHCLFD